MVSFVRPFCSPGLIALDTFTTNILYNLLFIISFAFCTYFYTLAMLEDPGYVSISTSRAQQKAIIDELLTLWKYDDKNYCIQCNVRMPVRSKHCRRCGRCVAKYDQYAGKIRIPLSSLADYHLVIARGSTIALLRTTCGILIYT